MKTFILSVGDHLVTFKQLLTTVTRKLSKRFDIVVRLSSISEKYEELFVVKRKSFILIVKDMIGISNIKKQKNETIKMIRRTQQLVGENKIKKQAMTFIIIKNGFEFSIL